MTKGISKALVLGGVGWGGTTAAINVLGTFELAPANKTNAGGGLGFMSMTPSTIQPSAWTQLLLLRSSRQ